MTNKRFPFLDCLRGCAILVMIVFHICYDINEIKYLNTDWPYLPWVRAWQQCIVLSFIFISGLSFRLMSFGKRIRNGLKLLLVGQFITLCTQFFMPQEQIIFGVITFLGCGLLLTAIGTRLLEKFIQQLPLYLSMSFCALMFLLTYTVQTGLLKIGPLVLLQWPDFLYSNNLYILGFPDENFFSTDYVPILPHIFMYWLGCGFYSILKEQTVQLEYCPSKWLAVIGKHGLIIYLVHQPLLLGVILGLSR